MTWPANADGMPSAADVFGDDRPDTATSRAPAPVEPDPCNQTDAGNAEYFAALYGSDVRYDHRRAHWLLWRRHRWEPDADAEIRRLAKTAMRQRFIEAAALDDPDARRRAAKWAITSESRARLDALLYLAQAEQPIADAGAGWDATRGCSASRTAWSTCARDGSARAAVTTGSRCRRPSRMTPRRHARGGTAFSPRCSTATPT